jgi:rod shape-determining protein MreC
MNNHLTINRGSNHGIQKGMGVISANGVIGKVKDVSSNYAVVFPLLHQQGQVTGRIVNSGHFGQISWNGRNHKYVQLNKIQRHAEFSEGDTIVSDVRSQIFPSGIPIGTIKSAELDNETQFYNLEIELLPDFTNIEYVYVINDLLKEERLNLESATIDNE